MIVLRARPTRSRLMRFTDDEQAPRIFKKTKNFSGEQGGSFISRQEMAPRVLGYSNLLY